MTPLILSKYRFINKLIFNYLIRCKLADFGLARSLSQNHPTFDSNGNEEACLTDYVGKSNKIACNGYYMSAQITRIQAHRDTAWSAAFDRWKNESILTIFCLKCIANGFFSLSLESVMGY